MPSKEKEPLVKPDAASEENKEGKKLTLMNDEEAQSLFKQLTVYTLLIIFIPIASYFGGKKYVLEDMLGYSRGDSFIYWAVISIAAIHVVLGVMVYRAYREGTKVRQIKQD